MTRCNIPISVLLGQENEDHNLMSICTIIGSAKGTEPYVLMETPSTTHTILLFNQAQNAKHTNATNICTQFFIEKGFPATERDFENNCISFQNTVCSMPRYGTHAKDNEDLFTAINKMCNLVDLDSVIGYANVPGF